MGVKIGLTIATVVTQKDKENVLVITPRIEKMTKVYTVIAMCMNNPYSKSYNDPCGCYDTTQKMA